MEENVKELMRSLHQIQEPAVEGTRKSSTEIAIKGDMSPITVQVWMPSIKSSISGCLSTRGILANGVARRG